MAIDPHSSSEEDHEELEHQLDLSPDFSKVVAEALEEIAEKYHDGTQDQFESN